MQWTSAPNKREALLPQRARSYWKAWFSATGEELEALLEAERAQLPLWAVAGFGTGIACWFGLPGPVAWEAFLCLTAGLAVAGFGFGRGRTGRAIGWFALVAMLGCALVWARSEWVARPVLERPVVASFAASVETVDHLASRQSVRLLLRTADRQLPPRLRVTLKEEDFPAGIAPGAQLRLRARLAPPPPMALPGTYDLARDAWFRGIGAVGKTLGPVAVVRPAVPSGLDGVRDRLRRQVSARLAASPGGIAIALATGDQNSVGEADAAAMRRSGLTHLLSVSGLHIAAAVGFAMFLTLRLLALSESLALRFNLVLVAAGAGAVAGVGYTLLTGAQVPTVRSCVAALLVLGGIALGRDALSLRLIAAGALAVMVFRPEAVAGPSFQMSFAAVTAIVAFHSTPFARRLFQRREESRAMRFVREIGTLIATGLSVELALSPLALYHFHRSGLYGVGANIVAIPLTTFVIMPLEAGALLLDAIGLGRPLWYLCGLSIDALLGLAHWVASASGAVTMMPSMSRTAFIMMVGGGVWLCLWATRWRLLGLAPLMLGAIAAFTSPTPDLLVTGDGKHVALVDRGTPFLLRARDGDYVRGLIAEASGFDGDPADLESRRFSRCSPEACVAAIRQGSTDWRVLATRSATYIDWPVLARACSEADIAISERRLPRTCKPRWLKLDRSSLASSGGLAIYLGAEPRIASVAALVGNHPWVARPFSRSASQPLRPSVSKRLPHRKFIARRVDELEPAPARKGEDRLGNDSAGVRYRVERGLKVVDPDHRQGR
ncbi:MAG: ComEC/Rec2 family competence protein [Sphingomicrobium sp.]